VSAELRSLLAREPGLLAAVEIGPRSGTAAAGVDTQVIEPHARGTGLIEERTRELGIAEGYREGARAVTKIGHAPADSTGMSMAPSGVVVVPRKPAGVGRGLVIGLVASIGAATIVTLAWLAITSTGANDRAAVEQPVEPVAAPAAPNELEGAAAEVQPAAVLEQREVDTPIVAPSDPKLVEAVSEREPREVAATESRKRIDKPKADPEPPTKSSDAPEPDSDAEPPPSEPPPSDPTPPAPESDAELPTIKDDVYD
jgi:hypothetical protein